MERAVGVDSFAPQASQKTPSSGAGAPHTSQVTNGLPLGRNPEMKLEVRS
jgi:hypothetical protein